jgi:glutaconate CoA-transferase subunit B
MNACTKFEQFLLTGANQISESAVTFVGFHWPMLMARIARRLHAPNVIIVYENGIVEDRLTPIFPTSPSDLTAAENSPACAGSLEALYMWLGAGRAEMTILEAAIVDRFGNINTTAVGSYSRPKVRLPGSGGGTELGSLGRNLLLVSASTNKRSYPAQVDYITSPGYLGGREERKRLGYKLETGPKTLVNPSGLFQFDESGEMYATALHAGVSRKEVKESFSWDMKVDDNLSILAEPGLDQLSIIREEIAHAKERLYIIPGN